MSVSKVKIVFIVKVEVQHRSFKFFHHAIKNAMEKIIRIFGACLNWIGFVAFVEYSIEDDLWCEHGVAQLQI